MQTPSDGRKIKRAAGRMPDEAVAQLRFSDRLVLKCENKFTNKVRRL